MSIPEQQVAALQISTNQLLTWLLQEKSKALNSEPEYSIGLFGQQISHVLAFYPQGKPTHQLTLPRFRIPSDRKHEPIRRLAASLRHLRSDLQTALIFSSVASREAIPHWSDVDILVIIRNDVFSNPSRLTQLRTKLQKLESHLYTFDPWQHHGFQFITESDLQFYPESFLPLAALRDAASLLAPTTLTLAVRESLIERRQYFLNVVQTLIQADQDSVLRHHPKDGIYLQDKYRNQGNTFYQFKYFISVILLLPSLFIGLVEQPIAKKESFTRIKQYFNPSELEFLLACERVRLLFQDICPKANEIPDAVRPVLGKNYFARAAQFALRLRAGYEALQSAPKEK